MKRPRVRFSIFTLLVTVAVISVGLVLWERYVSWPRAQSAFQDICLRSATPESGSRFDAIVQRYPQLAKDPLAMGFAAGSGSVDRCERLLKRGSPLNDPANFLGFKPFHRAIDNGHADVVEFFIAKGIDPTSSDSMSDSTLSRETPLFFASACGNVDVCRVLIAAGADVNHATESGGHPLFAAVLSGNPQLVTFLLDQGATLGPNTYGPHRAWVQNIRRLASHIPTTKSDTEKIIQLLETRLPQPAMQAPQGTSP